MISREYCKAFAIYNMWQNENLAEALKSVNEDEWSKYRSVFFGSIQGTLNHLLYGDRAWLDRFNGNPVSVTDPAIILADSIASWAVMRNDMDKEILRWADTVTDEWLSQDYKFYSHAYKKEVTKPMWLLVTHFFNHQTHHRSQATTILNQMGLSYGVTDMPWMP